MSNLVTDMAPIAGLTSLAMLNLGGTKVTDPGMKGIAGLTSLQELTIWGTVVSDAGLVQGDRLGRRTFNRWI